MRFDPASEFCVSFDDVLRLGVWARTSIDRFCATFQVDEQLHQFTGRVAALSAVANPRNIIDNEHSGLGAVDYCRYVRYDARKVGDIDIDRRELHSHEIVGKLWMLPLLASV